MRPVWGVFHIFWSRLLSISPRDAHSRSDWYVPVFQRTDLSSWISINFRTTAQLKNSYHGEMRFSRIFYEVASMPFSQDFHAKEKTEKHDWDAEKRRRTRRTFFVVSRSAKIFFRGPIAFSINRFHLTRHSLGDGVSLSSRSDIESYLFLASFILPWK